MSPISFLLFLAHAYNQAFNSLRERTRQAEIEADAKVRAQEQCEVLKKKLESMKNNHSSSSEKTSDMHQVSRGSDKRVFRIS